MNIEILKRSSPNLDVSVNSRGGKSLYISKPKDDYKQIVITPRKPTIEFNKPNTQNSKEKQYDHQPLIVTSKKPENSNNTVDISNDNEQTQTTNTSENKTQQKEYIIKVQKLINQILNDKPQTIPQKIKSYIGLLKENIDTITKFDDYVLKETKILLQYVNLFLNQFIVNNDQYNDLYKIFFDDDYNFIIGSKLSYYFKINDITSVNLIINFVTKIFNTSIENKSIMIAYLQKVNQDSATFSKDVSNILKETINEFENNMNLENKKEFLFDEATMFSPIKESELTNDYLNGWSSIQTYIQVMFNLTIENYFYPLRNHLAELRNNELDPRDLYLYENVKIYPSYEFNERSEYDLFIHFSVRAPTYKEGQTIKRHRIREIDWELTERLSNRSLLFFSLSPLMETIEAVGLSCAKKGQIQNNIVPVQFLKGYLDIDKEYYMFEPVDHWNGPFYDNLLSTSELTLSKSLIKPIISLNLSDNLISNYDSINIKLICLLRNQVGFKLPKFELLSTNEEVKFYAGMITANLDHPNVDADGYYKTVMSNLCKYLKDFERGRGKFKKFDENSEVIKGINLEIKRHSGFRIGNEKWPFDDLSEKEFREKIVVDHEQYKAIKYCLSHHLTLVNGAPGTGKTYLACELIKLLIKSDYNHPILVVTYKNVSLDGLLDNLAPFLQRSRVDFVRIGGRPRTENKYILSKIAERKIPFEIQKLKKQIMYLTILGSKINKSLSFLVEKKINECSKYIINDIDKSINIREIMFDKYPFYDLNEEEIISNFFDPFSMIPSADEYFQCWILGNDYYNKLKVQKHNEYVQKLNNLLAQIISFYYTKEGEEKNELIAKIIKHHFYNNELLFRKFLHQNKSKITNKDITIIHNIIGIIKENNFITENDGTFFDLSLNSSRLISYIKSDKSEFIPIENQPILKDKFTKILKSLNKIESFTQFIKDLSVIIKDQIQASRQICSEKEKEFEKREVKSLGDELSKKKLIAMTATRAAQYKLSLDRCGCQFMIIEEAGELTEPMAFSIIPKTIQHLVMIGDYRQLRPTVEHKLTFQPYNYNISLFEKEIIHSKTNESDNLFTLSIQRRMHPQISYLLRKVFYNNNESDEKLIDDESTFNLAKPLGMPNHIQFWLHEFEEESENKKMRSHINIKEAQICAHLFLLMLCRGYKSSEITIISLYKGQKRQIERELCKLIDTYYNDQDLITYDAFDFENDLIDYKPEKKPLNELVELRKSLVSRFVVCLDDFQGEENKVIIVSLTRSEKPGFVKNENRALVILSRAREMEFIIGNKRIFGEQNDRNPLWRKIASEASLIDDFSMHFNGIAACSCPIHDKNGKTMILNKPSDFIECRFNCCKEKCDSKNQCDHKCDLPCHLHQFLHGDFIDVFERRYFCIENCEKCCRKGHHCEEVCGNCMHYGCPPCPHNSPSRCCFSGCINRCCLSCSHSGPCQCLCVGFCQDCNCQIKDYHNKLKLWDGTILVCTKCFYRRLELRRKGIPDDLTTFLNA